MATTTEHVDLAITGMTCASCANRIERKLNKLEGVSASVNYATEQASVDFDPAQANADDLVGAVEAAGYQAAPPAGATDAGTADTPADPTAALRQRLLVSVVLTVPVLVLSMIPPLQFDNWQWLSLTLAAPVVVLIRRPPG
jgi:Cu+-exporting ATPase